MVGRSLVRIRGLGFCGQIGGVQSYLACVSLLITVHGTIKRDGFEMGKYNQQDKEVERHQQPSICPLARSSPRKNQYNSNDTFGAE